MSALTGEGIDELVSRLETIALGGKRLCRMRIPMTDQAVVGRLYSASLVEEIEYTDEGAEVTALLDEENRGRYAKYIVE